ncbi:hypothetical protein J6590_019501 [Homalodisca vitripennis]|nr:hypothetical protein J6590_019501 [Homalodisca vitripennis]
MTYAKLHPSQTTSSNSVFEVSSLTGHCEPYRTLAIHRWFLSLTTGDTSSVEVHSTHCKILLPNDIFNDEVVVNKLPLGVIGVEQIYACTLAVAAAMDNLALLRPDTTESLLSQYTLLDYTQHTAVTSDVLVDTPVWGGSYDGLYRSQLAVISSHRPSGDLRGRLCNISNSNVKFKFNIEGVLADRSRRTCLDSELVYTPIGLNPECCHGGREGVERLVNTVDVTITSAGHVTSYAVSLCYVLCMHVYNNGAWPDSKQVHNV